MDSVAAVSAATTNTNRNPCLTGPRVRGSIQAASRVKMPSSAAHAVVVMIARIEIIGRHRSASACATSTRDAMPLASATASPVRAPIAGAQGLRQISATVRASAIAMTANNITAQLTSPLC
ncbi:MAG: hypothetical protein WKG01_08970 [Kofleriaceae bacterium]